MAGCSYGWWDGVHRPRRCYRTARFLARTHRERLMCSHHAAMTADLGWPVTSIDTTVQQPAYEPLKDREPQVLVMQEGRAL